MVNLEVQEQEMLEAIAAKAERDAAGPKGKLIVSPSHGHVQYYQRTPEGSRTYIPASDTAIAQALAQKEYAKDVLKAVRMRQRMIARETTWRKRHCLCEEEKGPTEHVNPEQSQARDMRVCLAEGPRKLLEAQPNLECIKSIYERLSAERKNLVEPYLCPDSLFVENWRKEIPAEKTISSDGCNLSTMSGFQVRSKSEVIIADRLTAAGIPFRYEQPMATPQNRKVHPDFLLLIMPHRQEVIWEHFGLMDNLEYCAHATKKLALYANAGLHCRNGLIVTFESGTTPLGTNAVDAIIASLQ